VYRGLFFGQKNAVPGRPFLNSIPSNHGEFFQLSASAENRLTVPEVLYDVANVWVLKELEPVRN